MAHPTSSVSSSTLKKHKINKLKNLIKIYRLDIINLSQPLGSYSIVEKLINSGAIKNSPYSIGIPKIHQG